MAFNGHNTPFIDLAHEHVTDALDVAVGSSIFEINDNDLPDVLRAVFPGCETDELVRLTVSDPSGEKDLRTFEVVAVDADALVEEGTMSLHALLCVVYLAGRIDECKDVLGLNSPRTVKARDIGKIITYASVLEPDLYDERAGILNTLQALRNTIKEDAGH